MYKRCKNDWEYFRHSHGLPEYYERNMCTDNMRAPDIPRFLWIKLGKKLSYGEDYTPRAQPDHVMIWTSSRFERKHLAAKEEGDLICKAQCSMKSLQEKEEENMLITK